MNNIGEKVTEKIQLLKNKGFSVESKNDKQGRVFVIKSEEFLLEINVNPPEWLGLKFYLLDEKDKILLEHEINTDLYNLALPKYQSFAKEIETDIINFIDSIVNGSIKVGLINDKPAMIVPQYNEFLLIKKGKFFVSNEVCKDLSKIALDESFRELKVGTE